MKKTIVIALFAILTLGAFNLYAGIPHIMYIEIFEDGGTTHPGATDLTYQAWIVGRESEILTETSTGCNWNTTVPGFATVQVGNFPTAWSIGETFHLLATQTSTGDEEYGEWTLTSAAYQYLAGNDGITLPVELSAFTATFMEDYTLISWSTASETDVLGFNIYRSTEDEYSTSTKINVDYIPGHGTTTEPHSYEFQDIDQLEFETTYYYWLESVNYGGGTDVYGSINYTPEQGQGGYDEDFSTNMLMNQPNPFRDVTTINYAIKGMPKTEPVNISIYNTLGQLIKEDTAKNGVYQLDASDLTPGVYFYKIQTESYNKVQKMMILR